MWLSIVRIKTEPALKVKHQKSSFFFSNQIINRNVKKKNTNVYWVTWVTSHISNGGYKRKETVGLAGMLVEDILFSK